jgi:hypothetical protein
MKRQHSKCGPVGDPALRTASDPTCSSCGFVVCICMRAARASARLLEQALGVLCAGPCPKPRESKPELRPGWHRNTHYPFPVYSRTGTPDVYESPSWRWRVEGDRNSSCADTTYATLELAMIRAEQLAVCRGVP